MKKLISCVLAVALVFSLMGVSVFADAVVGNGVDPATNDDTLTDGVENFTDKTSSGNITVNFTAPTDGSGNQTGTTMEDRYAIDITYSDLVIDLTQMQKLNAEGTAYEPLNIKYVWNVNTHQYDAVDPATDEVLPGGDETNNTTIIQINSFKVTNHSSKSIFYKAALDINSDVETVMTVTTDEESNEVLRATTGKAQDGDQEIITATPVTNWLDTINALAADYATTNSQIGTITITFSMAAIPTVTP